MTRTIGSSSDFNFAWSLDASRFAEMLRRHEQAVRQFYRRQEEQQDTAPDWRTEGF